MRQKAAKDRSNLHQPDATSLRFVASGKPQASIFANRLAVPCREFFALRLDSEGPITEASLSSSSPVTRACHPLALMKIVSTDGASAAKPGRRRHGSRCPPSRSAGWVSGRSGHFGRLSKAASSFSIAIRRSSRTSGMSSTSSAKYRRSRSAISSSNSWRRAGPAAQVPAPSGS